MKTENTREHQVSVTVNTVHRTHPFWRRLINLGYAENLRELSLRETLSKTQSGIGFHYGRICRITDLITPLSDGENAYYDYSEVFDLLNQILHQGITPFLELGNKYLIIQEDANRYVTPGDIPDPADYYAKLEEQLPGLLRACVNYYGQEVVDTWRFEISYDFNAPADMKESFGFVSYIREFRKLRKIIRSCSQHCLIGGPGFNDWSSEEKITTMLRQYRRYRVIPDFFTAYAYPVADKTPGHIKLSEDLETSAHRIRDFSIAVHSVFPEKEIWVTEFNSNLSSRNFLNESVWQAAYLAKTISCLMSSDIRALGYYLLSDAPLRYRDIPDFLFGGWGLITDTGIPKASFRLFELLSKLGHYRIRQGRGCVICADSPGRIQIFVHRICGLTKSALSENVKKEDLLTPDLVFAGRGRDTFCLKLSGLLAGTYVLREYRINCDQGNLFAVWRDSGFLTANLPGTARDLEAASFCSPHFDTCIVGNDGILSRRLLLTDNEVVLLCANRSEAQTEDALEAPVSDLRSKSGTGI